MCGKSRDGEHTFITTGIPLSARTRGANSEPRYDSRLSAFVNLSAFRITPQFEYLHRWLVANMAMEGVPPHLSKPLSLPEREESRLAYVRFSTSGTRYAAEAWWKAAMGNLNSFDKRTLGAL